MKLSKNRLNKIKLKRNASRKKYKLRTQRGQYENSKKRNKRDTHLNRKTLKVYVGSGNPFSKSTLSSDGSSVSADGSSVSADGSSKSSGNDITAQLNNLQEQITNKKQEINDTKAKLTKLEKSSKKKSYIMDKTKLETKIKLSNGQLSKLNEMYKALETVQAQQSVSPESAMSAESAESADGLSESAESAMSAESADGSLTTSGSADSESSESPSTSGSAVSADGSLTTSGSLSSESAVSTDNCNLQLKQLCSQYYNDTIPAVKEIDSIADYKDEPQDRALCAKHALNNMFKNNIFVSTDDSKEYKINTDRDRDNELRKLLRKTDTDTINLYSICKILEAHTTNLGQTDKDPCSTGGSYSYADVTTALSIAGYKFSELASNNDINLSIASIQNALKMNPIGIILTTGELNGGHFITIRRTENTNEYEIVDSLKLGSKDAIFNASNATEILTAWFTNNNVNITPNGMIVVESFIGKYIPPYDQSMGQHTLYVDATGNIYQTIGVLYNKPFLEDITSLFCVKPYINNNSDERLNTPAIEAFNSWDAEINKADIADRTAMRYNETRPENIALVNLLSAMDKVKHVDRSTVELKSGKGEYVEISMDILNDYVNHIMTGSPIGSTTESPVETNTALKAAEALKKYECDPNSITDDVPDDENEADTKFDTLNDSILYCSEENKTELLDKWSTYIDNFEKKFNKKPSGFTMSISNECVNLFVGEMNYNIVPDTKEKAEEKFGQYIKMMERDITANSGKCAASIDAALKIYMDNMNKMYPSDQQSETTSVSDDQSVSSSESDEQMNEPAEQQMNEQDQPMNEPEQQMNSSNDQADPASSQPPIITSDDISRIFTKIKDSQETDTISMTKFIKFLVNRTDNDSIMVRKAIGFDEPFTMNEIITGKDAYAQNVPSLAKNSQIFNSLLKTYTQFENKNKMGGADTDSDQSSNFTEINEQLFAKFINCGQYRNKSENIFDCKTVKIPDESSGVENTDQDLSPVDNQEQNDSQSTADPNNNNNIVLELHEKEYNDEFKRVTIDVLIRKDAAKDIIVKDYTGNSAIETLANIASSPN